MKLLNNRTAVCCSCTNGVTLCRTLMWVCRSDKLRLVLNGGYAKNHPVRRSLTPLQRRGIVCLCLLCFTALFSNADGVEAIASENHFQTQEKPSQPAKPQQQQVDPLVAYPATQYVVHGVIVAADNAVAVVYSPNNTWHRLQVDAQLGQEQAVIQQITTRGIQIKMQDTLLWLPVLQ